MGYAGRLAMTRTFDQLERLRRQAVQQRAVGTVRLIYLRKGDGMHTRVSRSRPRDGRTRLEGDRWASGAACDPERQVTLMPAQVATWLTQDHAPLESTGDNLLVRAAGLESVPPRRS